MAIVYDVSTQKIASTVAEKDTEVQLTSFSIVIGPFTSEMDCVGLSDICEGQYQDPAQMPKATLTTYSSTESHWMRGI